MITLQPDLQLPDAGLYDALSLTQDARLSSSFEVDLTWLGQGEPSAQPFLAYGPGFVTLETGATIPLPEPGSGMLLFLGLAMAARSGRPSRREGPR